MTLRSPESSVHSGLEPQVKVATLLIRCLGLVVDLGLEKLMLPQVIFM